MHIKQNIRIKYKLITYLNKNWHLKFHLELRKILEIFMIRATGWKHFPFSTPSCFLKVYISVQQKA